VAEPATEFLAEHPRLYLTSVQTSSSAGRGGFLNMVVCLALALVASARNYRRLDSEGSRRRIRWVLAGLAVALIPFNVLNLARGEARHRPDPLVSARDDVRNGSQLPSAAVYGRKIQLAGCSRQSPQLGHPRRVNGASDMRPCRRRGSRGHGF
jgi:hypothetical protein